MVAVERPEDGPVRRWVVLGASNIARNFAIVLATARCAAGGPMEFLTANGHGRAYGMASNVLGRGLPSVLECGLWEALSERASLPTWGLVTDIGNDLIYGASPEGVASAVERTVERLRPYCERLVMTGLPLATVRSLGPKRFRFFRLLLFPRSPLTHLTVYDQCCDLNDRIMRIAERYEACFVEPVEAWYGLDPVHVTFRQAATAWQHIFSQFAPCERIAWPPPSVWWTALTARPQREHFFGIAVHRKQPAAQWSDGSTISLY